MDQKTTKSDSFTHYIKSFINENKFYRLLQDYRRALCSYFSKIHKILCVNLG